MPKAIFIMDMPETCGKCKFLYEFQGVKKCQLMNELNAEPHDYHKVHLQRNGMKSAHYRNCRRRYRKVNLSMKKLQPVLNV